MSLAFDLPEDLTIDPVVVTSEFDDLPAVQPLPIEPLATEVVEITETAEAAEPQAVASQGADALAPAEPTIDAMDSEKYWLLLDLTGQLADAERYRLQCEAELQECREATKQAKDSLSHATSRCHAVTEKIMAEITGNAQRIARDSMESQPRPVSISQVIEPTSQADDDDESWKDTPTAEVLADVKGLGKKKLEALIEVAPTIGALEELRATCYNGDFREVLPSGFGEKIADAIEAATMEFVRKYGSAKMSCAEQVKLNGLPKAEAEPAKAETEIDDSEWSLKKEEVEAMVEATRQEAESLDWSIEDCTYREDDKSTHEETLAGYANFYEPQSTFYDFPKHYSVKQIERWIDGWVSAERLELLKSVGDEFSDL